jgi:hypothetical protein
VNRARQPVPSCPASAQLRSPLAARPSRCAPVSLSLASFPQLSENKAILSPAIAALAPRIDAQLTRVNHNPFVCHSYEKHRGWGMPLQSSRSLFPSTSPARARKNPHTNAPQPKSFHTFTSHFSVYRGIRVAPSSAAAVSGACPDSVGALESPFQIAGTPTASRKSSPATSTHCRKPSPATSSLFTTHYPRLTLSTVRFTRRHPGATHV